MNESEETPTPNLGIGELRQISGGDVRVTKEEIVERFGTATVSIGERNTSFPRSR
jgi:hypothetical protein